MRHQPRHFHSIECFQPILSHPTKLSRSVTFMLIRIQICIKLVEYKSNVLSLLSPNIHASATVSQICEGFSPNFVSHQFWIFSSSIYLYAPYKCLHKLNAKAEETSSAIEIRREGIRILKTMLVPLKLVVVPLKNIEFSLGLFCSKPAFLEYRQMRGGWKESHYSNSFITRQSRQHQSSSGGSLEVLDKGPVMHFEITHHQSNSRDERKRQRAHF